jgi:hypothetical protein
MGKTARTMKRPKTLRPLTCIKWKMILQKENGEDECRIAKLSKIMGTKLLRGINSATNNTDTRLHTQNIFLTFQ